MKNTKKSPPKQPSKKSAPKQVKLTKSEMVCLIAEDVLNQIYANKYVLTDYPGVCSNSKDEALFAYVDRITNTSCGDTGNLCQYVPPVDIRGFATDKGKYNVGLMGALFVSLCRVTANPIYVKTSTTVDNLVEGLDGSPLAKVFKLSQLDRMDECFGQTSMPAVVGLIYQQEYPNNKKRMIVIMENLLRNDGVFKAEQDLSKLAVLKFAEEFLVS